VRIILMGVAKSGLPGEHHFFIAFRTHAPGVSISKRLEEKYPEEMTIVLQHRFWDLVVKEDHFEVKLSFDGIMERLRVPFEAIKVFFDPSVPYGLQFEDIDISGHAAHEVAAPQRGSGDAKPAVSAIEATRAKETPAARSDKKQRTPRRSQADKPTERADKPHGKQLPIPITSAEPSPADGPKVVSIDAFRNKK
jgi:uncharacterized protein